MKLHAVKEWSILLFAANKCSVASMSSSICTWNRYEVPERTHALPSAVIFKCFAGVQDWRGISERDHRKLYNSLVATSMCRKRDQEEIVLGFWKVKIGTDGAHRAYGCMPMTQLEATHTCPWSGQEESLLFIRVVTLCSVTLSYYQGRTASRWQSNFSIMDAEQSCCWSSLGTCNKRQDLPNQLLFLLSLNYKCFWDTQFIDNTTFWFVGCSSLSSIFFIYSRVGKTLPGLEIKAWFPWLLEVWNLTGCLTTEEEWLNLSLICLILRFLTFSTI